MTGGALLSALLLAAPASAVTADQPPDGSLAAREQARLCEKLSGEESVAACRSALALGLGPSRAASVRQLLAFRLASLDRWDEVVAVYREAARLRPGDADAQLRLGSALLLAADQPEEALEPLREAFRLRPTDPRPHVLLGDALNALGRHGEAVAAFEEALRLDPEALDGLPAAQAALAACRRQQAWP